MRREKFEYVVITRKIYKWRYRGRLQENILDSLFFKAQMCVNTSVDSCCWKSQFVENHGHPCQSTSHFMLICLKQFICVMFASNFHDLFSSCCFNPGFSILFSTDRQTQTCAQTQSHMDRHSHTCACTFPHMLRTHAHIHSS